MSWVRRLRDRCGGWGANDEEPKECRLLIFSHDQSSVLTELVWSLCARGTLGTQNQLERLR